MNHVTLAGPMKWIPVFIMMAAPLAAQDRLDWFQHGKFGMFIHFGLYSALAGEWKGQRVPVGTPDGPIVDGLSVADQEQRATAAQFVD